MYTISVIITHITVTPSDQFTCMLLVQYERQLAECQEKTNRLQRRLTQAEQREATAAQQVSVITGVCVLCR